MFYKSYSIKAVLRKKNFANFYKYFHEQDAQSDYFYKKLKKIVDQQQLIFDNEIGNSNSSNNSSSHLSSNSSSNLNGNLNKIFKPSMTEEGFIFKITPNTQILDKKSMPIEIENLFDFDCTFDLSVGTYEFTTDQGVKIIGVCIKVKKIKLAN